MPINLAESDITNYAGLLTHYSGPEPTVTHSPKHQNFMSPLELLSFIDNNSARWPRDPIGKRSQATYHSAKDINFFGTETWDEARCLALEGWLEGCSLLVEANSHVAPLTRERVNQSVFDVAGVVPHVPRFIAGDPEYMQDIRPVLRGTRPVLKIAVSPNCGYHVTQAQRVIWGAAVVSWINHQVLGGTAIEVSTIYVSRTRRWYINERKLGPPVVVEMLLKASDQEVSLPEFAFWLMHNAAHRRMQFAVKERMAIGRWYSFNEVYGIAIVDVDDISSYCSKEKIIIPFCEGLTSVEDGMVMIEKCVDSWEKRQSAATEVAAD